MVVTTSLGANTYVYLSGAGFSGSPSLQYVLAASRLTVNAGDDDASTGVINSVTSSVNGLLGDELGSMYFQKADQIEPVTFQVLASFAPTGTVTLGWFNGATATAPTNNAVLSMASGQQSTFNPVTMGSTSFEPHDLAFGLYAQFAGSNTVYSRDSLNTFDAASGHYVRAYQYKDANGTVIPNQLVVAFASQATNKAYTDLVVVLRNVVPASALKIRTMTFLETPTATFDRDTATQSSPDSR